MRRAPRFWWRREAGAAAFALWPIARLYGATVAWRMERAPRYRPPVPVICVGNFVVGGAGKTPTALALARIARGRGLKPGFLSRGYGGSVPGPLLVSTSANTALTVGDEALLLAAAAPTVVARDRVAGARRLVAEKVDLIIMDDGFQNPRLAKDLSFVAVDAAAGIGNGMVMPAGPLRAPLGPQLRRADALIVIGEGDAAEPLIRAAARSGRATLRARLKPVRIKEWRKGPILAYAGIGRPEKFFASLAEVKAPVTKTMSFPDHHRYTAADADRLMREADTAGLRLVTTEKDMARFAGATGSLAKLRERSEAFPVVLEFENPAAIGEMIAEIGRALSPPLRER
jgi:tetraacyldisaccharide 4'-kinase